MPKIEEQGAVGYNKSQQVLMNQVINNSVLAAKRLNKLTSKNNQPFFVLNSLGKVFQLTRSDA